MSQLRELSQWDEEYLRSLPTGEFDCLEYKSSEKFTNSNWSMDMSKYVSAWANYEGGYIIFGVKDPNPGEPLIIDGGIPETVKPNLLNWLDDVIPALVELPLRKLTTWLIRPKSAESQIKPGHAVVVIHIPESEAAPHQAQDHKYYQRLGRRLEPLRHRAILDIAGRRRCPKVKTTIIVHIGAVRQARLFWKVENIGSVMARDWKVVIQFPTMIGKTYVRLDDDALVCDATEEGQSYQSVRITKRLGASLFPGSDISHTWDIEPCTYSGSLLPSVGEITVTTYADDTSPVQEVFPLADVLREH